MADKDKNYIELDGEQFELIDEIDNIPMADSFVRKNKIGCGHGEARLYIGSQKKRNFEEFFNEFNDTAFFLKKDFEGYLTDAKFEYEEKEQGYIRDISGDWEGYRLQLQSFSNREFFTLENAVGEKDTARYYIRSKPKGGIYKYFRNIMLPIISYVSILKIKNAEGKTFFFFRPHLSYSFNPYYHPRKEGQVEEEIEQRELPEFEKERLVKARYGQGPYREKLLKESAECVITRVNDERVLRASHIKPWSVSNDQEKVDHNNGLVLTPTYDQLFDQGFITFEDDGKIVISPYISPLNIKKLNLASGRKYHVLPTPKRKAYLAYHREHIFKK